MLTIKFVFTKNIARQRVMEFTRYRGKHLESLVNALTVGLLYVSLESNTMLGILVFETIIFLTSSIFAKYLDDVLHSDMYTKLRDMPIRNMDINIMTITTLLTYTKLGVIASTALTIPINKAKFLTISTL